MKKFLLASVALMSALPASAAVITPGGGSVTPSLFNTSDRDGGSFIASNQVVGSTATYDATFTTAVFRRANGLLDFYYQVRRTGGAEPIEKLTASNFAGWATDVYRDPTDSDAGSLFVAAANPGVFTTTASRNNLVVTFDFGSNFLENNDISATYIIRTNAYSLKPGFTSVIDGTTLTINGFAPAVPEPATWAMMVGGFGLLGAAARRSRRATTVLA